MTISLTHAYGGTYNGVEMPNVVTLTNQGEEPITVNGKVVQPGDVYTIKTSITARNRAMEKKLATRKENQ